ncbi:general amidase [Rhodocollybia butyracea]|uniref:General amidase n=1 Tax=Rhodocollybia butyracea TaxID=206335 RepID=A0A9P5Q2R5_9AGAR|nr:general amidase [Rhodocollybia butyracea]
MSDWQTRCAKRKQAQLESIPKEWIVKDPPQMNVMNIPKDCGLLSDHELEITETVDVEVILQKLAAGEWSSVEVTTAYYKRAIIAQQLTNCLTEIFIDRALNRAKELDEILKTTGKVTGPLHGLPISLKDQFTMKGLETIMGYAAWIGQYADSDCVLVEILYECGAVPFVRTNVPQTLMWGETHNNVFGRTVNPYNRYLTAGGSSGGEGALLAMKGSPLGVGTDIGGYLSVRIPSAFCGLYTLRPSYERLPYCGAVNALEGQESISSVLGPMANSMSGVKLFTKTIIDAKPWLKDPLAIRKEWSDKEYDLVYHGGGKRLCFGIMWDNGWFSTHVWRRRVHNTRLTGVVRPHPPLIRAMEITKRALEAAGHTVLDWEPHRHLEIYRNSETIFVADGGEDYQGMCELSGEPLLTSMLPEEGAHETTLEEPYVKRLVGKPYHRTAYELWNLHKEKRTLRKSHLDYWEATVSRTGTGRPIDAIISPAVAYAAVPHGLNTDSFYTTLCNAMDYATSVFPVTFVDGNLDHKHSPHEFYNHEDEAIYNLYDSGLFDGCPVGLQLIGRTQEEEAVIAMTEIVDRALREHEKGQESS